MQDPGTLYLGHRIDPETGERTDEHLELRSDRLTTHGVIVGMTGSGKTGLGIVLLEEVLASGVPALIIDPKGDMGNLLLNFPDFRAEDFEPWVDLAQARRGGVPIAQLAADTAARWQSGLAGSGIDGDRMRALRQSVDFRILTPGSTAGVPIDMVGDMRPPPLSFDEHGETIRDEIEGLVSGLLVMADIEADPLTSREHILLSNLIEHAWRNGDGVDLPTMLRQIQDPPLRRLGVFELDAFFPARDRTKLAMRLNGLVASPSFAEWLMGEPLDAQNLMFAPDGRPRASIVHLAHLSDSERMFAVTLLLSKLVSWTCKQPGTSELRALIYADEVMGFAPPTAEPPSKRPILTLYKQARAHGVGLVMATQNPVDLDYKLMSNAGTWMIGRLQTERDKARIIEGLRSASGDVDVSAWDARISALDKRQFVLKSARSPAPTLFTTRCAMSFLRGPLTRADLIRLAQHGVQVGDPVGATAAGTAGTATGRAPYAGSAATSGAGDTADTGSRGAQDTRTRAAATDIDSQLAPNETSLPPQVAPSVTVRYLDPAAPWARELGISASVRRLEPGLAARVRMLFDERVGDVRHEEIWEAVIHPLREQFTAEQAVAVDYDDRDFRDDAPADATYLLGDAPIDGASFFRDAERAIEEHLYRERTLQLMRNRELKLVSRPGESDEAFQKRCLAAAEDNADADAEKLRDRYERRIKSAQSKLSQAERRARELDVDVDQRRQQELISGAGAVLSMFLSGRRRVRGLSGMSSRRSQTRRTQERLRSAEEKVEEYEDAIADLEDELAQEIDQIWERWKESAAEIEPFEVPLERTDVSLDGMTLFWAAAG